MLLRDLAKKIHLLKRSGKKTVDIFDSHLSPEENAIVITPFNELCWVYWQADGQHRTCRNIVVCMWIGEKMLTGKYFPQNVRALRLLLEEVIGETIRSVTDVNDLTKKLNGMAKKSNTAKLWIDAFVNPMMTILLHIRAEREGEWGLHLASVELMSSHTFLLQDIKITPGMQLFTSMTCLDSQKKF